ncbi:RICIN domain-containing protein [Streptomyces sp. NPDC051567]|uniref:RICIN domain-containing protein n=1 Tax=Streptomyces sp. NPDC051567 TaxID=3365660 RepID=UPI0037BA6359
MSLWTSLEPSSATVDPGGSTRVRLRLRNTGDVVDAYRFEPVGPVAPWTTVEPQTLRLYPGTTGTVELTFAPPRTPDATAGPNPYAVRITPTEHPQAVTVPEGNLTVTPFTEVRAELVPPTVAGRFRGRPRLAVDNLGNTKLTASIHSGDDGDQVSYDLTPRNVQIEPGRAAFVEATLTPRRTIWFGSAERHPYTLSVQRSGVEPLSVEGTYVQRGFLPGWLATLFGTLVALAVVFVMLWLAYKPQVRTAATEQIQKAEVGAIAPSPSLPPPAPSTPAPGPSASPQPPAGSGNTGQGKGGTPDKSGAPAEPEAVVPARNVLLRNLVTKKCVDIPYYDKGKLAGPIEQYTCDGTSRDNQLWDLEVRYPKQGPGGQPLFQIRNVKDQLCLDLPDYGAQPPRTEIAEYTCDGTTADNQLWWLDRQDSGAYWIRNYASNNKCLDVFGSRTGTNGTRLTLFDCVNDDDQEWLIVHPGAG